MKPLSKEKRNHLILLAIGTVAVIAGIWQTMLLPQRNGQKAVQKRIAEQKTKLDNAQRLTDSMPQLQKNLELATAKLKTAEDAMASGDMYSWFIQTMKTFRQDHTNVDIPQFSREAPCAVGMFAKFPYKAVMFNLRGTAYFHDFGSFLADFENRYPYLRVQKLELEPAGVSSANSSSASTEDTEKLAFRMEIVALVNPLSQ
jgi:hypothetical protein